MRDSIKMKKYEVCSRIFFVEFTKNINLEDVHQLIASDFSSSDLNLEFSEVCELDLPNSFHRKSLMQILKILLDSDDSYSISTAIISRVIAAKPHSADVERLISCNNVFKSLERSSLKLSAKKFIFVYLV